MRLFGLLLVAAVVAPPIAVASAEEPRAQQKERRICRREPVTGTRLVGPRVCMTQREWDAITERAREDLGASQRRQTVAVPGMGGVSRCPTGVPC